PRGRGHDRRHRTGRDPGRRERGVALGGRQVDRAFLAGRRVVRRNGRATARPLIAVARRLRDADPVAITPTSVAVGRVVERAAVVVVPAGHLVPGGADDRVRVDPDAVVWLSAAGLADHADPAGVPRDGVVIDLGVVR